MSRKPVITPAPNGPYLVTDLTDLSNQKGKVATKPKLALCRCGGSANKPFCDGTHAKNGFSSDKQEGRVEDKLDTYRGRAVEIHDNRGTCAHAGYCTDGRPSVFKLNEEPWIDPEGAEAEEIKETINHCPSGALSYSQGGVHKTVRPGEPKIFIAPNGPYVVSGGPELAGTERLKGASQEHWTMCRCGGSKNKPFCDGTHWHIKFTDDKN